MSIFELVAVMPTSGLQPQASHPAVAWYFLIGLIAVVLALVVMIFIRTSSGPSAKQ